MSAYDYARYLRELNAPYQRIQDSKNSLSTLAGRTYSSWLTAPQGGLIPSTSIACTNATIGALGQQNTNSDQYLAQVGVNMAQYGYVMLVDRLVHQGGLSGIVTGSQTTNLPTVAIPRGTGSYAGIMAAIEIYTVIGTTTSLVSGSYLNQNGSVSTFKSTTIGTAVFNKVGQIIILPLQDGDTGVQQVINIALSASTTTAGNFGITLFRPLMAWAIPNIGGQQLVFDAITSNAMQLAAIENGACLHYIWMTGTTSTGVYQSALRFIEM
jgi:hypothetical protein